MERFRKTIQKRLWGALVYNAVFFIVVGSGFVHGTTGSNEHVRDFIGGSIFGVVGAIQLIVIYYMCKYNEALKNEDKLKKMYIYEKDERRRAIDAKIGGIGIHVIIVGISMAMVIAGFINSMVYFILGGVLIFSALTKGILKVYFNKMI